MYEKKLMTATELVGLGFPRSQVRAWMHCKDAPVIFTEGGGKAYFRTDDLDEFLKKWEQINKEQQEKRKKLLNARRGTK